MQQEVKEKIKLQRIGTFIPHKGHTIFKVNKETLEITEAEITTIPIKTNEEGKKLAKKKIISEEGFVYIAALNKKNVRKKLLKMVLKEKSK